MELYYISHITSADNERAMSKLKYLLTCQGMSDYKMGGKTIYFKERGAQVCKAPSLSGLTWNEKLEWKTVISLFQGTWDTGKKDKYQISWLENILSINNVCCSCSMNHIQLSG